MSISTLRRLRSADLRLLVLATTLVAGSRVALWVLPSRVIVRLVRRLLAGPERAARPARPSVERIGWAIDAAARRVPHATCLTQAVAGQLVLRRYGYSSQLRVGVRHESSGEFRAHAWIEREGRVLIGAVKSRAYIPLEFPGDTGVRSNGQLHHPVSP